MSVVDKTATPPILSGDAHRYRAYGLVIASDLPLPELDLETGDAHADLTIRLGPTGRGAPGSFPQNTFDFGDAEQFMCWPIVGAFLIKGVDEVIIERTSGVSDQLLPFPLLGPVFGVILHLRGLLVLHASAVRVGDGCAIFVGDKGDGKSTTAGAFVRAGHPLVTDDLLALDMGSRGPVQVLPAFPQIKLAADAEAALMLEGADARPLVLPDFEKRQQLLSGPFDHERLPPSAIYQLTRGDEARATPLSPTDALSAVMRFTYISRFPSRPLSNEEARDHLRKCATLASVTPVFKLETPNGLDRLDEIVRLVQGQLS